MITLLERNVERILGEDIETIRSRPLSEVHNRIRENNGGNIPESRYRIIGGDIVLGPEGILTREDVERAYRQAIKVPWHERLRNVCGRYLGIK